MSLTSGSMSESFTKDATTSATYPTPKFHSVRELEEEVVLLFYNSMLNLVVKEWHCVEDEDTTEVEKEEREVESALNVKDFKDLTREDLQSFEIRSVEGSKVSLAKHSKDGRSTSRTMRVSKSRSRSISSSSSRKFNRPKRKSKADELTSMSKDGSSIINPFDWILETYAEDVVITFRNGNVYRGPVEKRRFNGKGSFHWADGTVYEGDFKKGHITGNGKLIYNDNSYYIGGFCRGLLHGEGCMFITPTCLLYSGNWKAGKKHGKGWLFYNPGNWYDGEWLNDLRHGKGTRQYDKCSMYQGEWLDGQRHGHGTMVWSNHDYFCGEWKRGSMDGYGEYIWKAFFNKSFAYHIMNKFEGNWVEGTRSGEGVLDFGFAGGARMAGYWVKNMKHGPAVVICGNGKTVAGKPLFLYDKPVEPGVWYGKTRLSVASTAGDVNSNLSVHPQLESYIGLSLDSECSHQSVNLSDFPKIMSRHINPLCIPIHYEPKQVDLSYYLQLLAKKFNICTVIESVEEERVDDSTYQEILSFEEDKLRNVITSNYLALKCIYCQYAYIATKENPRFRPLLIRLFLWQLFFDMDISKRGMSLIDTDLCLYENPDCGLETEHDPFEKIYFWQFLQCLVAVSWKLYNNTTDLDSVEGTLAKILRKFIYDDVLPNAGKIKGTALCEYRDLLPIRSVYMLYRSIGDPPTVRKLYVSCILKGYPLCSEKILESDDIKYIKAGSNITAIGATIIYLQDELEIGSQQKEPIPYPFKYNNMVLRNLHIFTKMKRKKLIECIAKICPPIIENGMIVNMDYPISFLEFYNIILLITYTKIDDILNREVQKQQMKLAQEQAAMEAQIRPSKKSIFKKKK